jgi:hypothetical protein
MLQIIKVQITKEFLERVHAELAAEGKLTPEVIAGLQALIGRDINLNLPKCEIHGVGMIRNPGTDGWHDMTRAEQLAGGYVDNDGKVLKKPEK